MLKKIPENVQEDSGKWSTHSGYCLRRFKGMFNTILGNTQEDWTLYNAFKRKQNQIIYAQA